MRVLIGDEVVPFNEDVHVGKLLSKLHEVEAKQDDDDDEDDVIKNNNTEMGGKKRKRKRGKAV
jgi:hypothetical protein